LQIDKELYLLKVAYLQVAAIASKSKETYELGQNETNQPIKRVETIANQHHVYMYESWK
jgi:hypothetical protein